MVRLFYALLFMFMATSFTESARIVCEFKNRATYKANDGRLLPENINPRLCTHINYDFLRLTFDFRLDNLYPNDPENIQKLVSLKYQNPSLKIIASVGGWDQGSEGFSSLARNDWSRKIFVQSAVEYLRKYNLDGLNIAWSFPASRGGYPEDKNNFILLLQELRAAFYPYNLLLTISAPSGKTNIDAGYDVLKISSLVDYINLMTYDLKGTWDNAAGHSSQLYALSSDYPNLLQANQDWVVNYWLSLGAPAYKLNLGIPFYGRSYTLADSTKTLPGSPIKGSAQPGQITYEELILSYSDVCQKLNLGWRQGSLDFPQQPIPYAYGYNNKNGETEWVGYENVNSVSMKASYALNKGLGGVAIWALDLDDTTGKYCNQGAFPLLITVNNALGNLVPSYQCVQEPGVDYIGNDLNSVVVENADACCKVCSETPNCQSWSFVVISKTCWMKTGLGLSKKIDSGVISGYINNAIIFPPSTLPPTTLPPTTTTTTAVATTTTKPISTCSAIQYNVNYPGNDIFQFGSATLEDCCAKCSKTPQCYSWTYLIEYRYCFLKNQLYNQYNSYELANAISGRSLSATATFVCTGTGIFPDRYNGCKNFIMCVYNGNNILEPKTIPCGDGLLYDAKNEVCNYPENVVC